MWQNLANGLASLGTSRGPAYIGVEVNQGISPEPTANDGHAAPKPKTAARGKWRRWLRSKLHVLAVVALLLLGIVIYFADKIFIVIPAGHVGALWNRFSGTRVDRVFREGLHIISPLDVMTPYEVRKQIVLHELDVLSVEGLTLNLELAIRFRPEYDLVGLLHQDIGPEYMIRVVVPQTESVLRKQLGNATAVQIYTNEGGLLTRAMLRAMNEAGRNSVEVEDIIVRSIRLPGTVKTAIEQKIRQSQLLASYTFRRETAVKEAERKRIEADGIRDYQALIDETLSERLLVYQGIQATRDLAASVNPKTLVVGAGSSDLALPIFLGDMTKAKKAFSGISKVSDLATPDALDAGTIKALANPTIALP